MTTHPVFNPPPRAVEIFRPRCDTLIEVYDWTDQTRCTQRTHTRSLWGKTPAWDTAMAVLDLIVPTHANEYGRWYYMTRAEYEAWSHKL